MKLSTTTSIILKNLIENYLELASPLCKEEVPKNILTIKNHAVLAGNFSAIYSSSLKDALTAVQSFQGEEIIILTDYKKYILVKYENSVVKPWGLYNGDLNLADTDFYKKFNNCSDLSQEILNIFNEKCFAMFFSTLKKISNDQPIRKTTSNKTFTLSKDTERETVWDELNKKNLKNFYVGKGSYYILLNYSEFNFSVKQEIIKFLSLQHNQFLKQFLGLMRGGLLFDLNQVKENFFKFLKENENDLSKVAPLFSIDSRSGLFVLWNIAMKNEELALKLFDNHCMSDTCYQSFYYLLIKEYPSFLGSSKEEMIDAFASKNFSKFLHRMRKEANVQGGVQIKMLLRLTDRRLSESERNASGTDFFRKMIQYAHGDKKFKEMIISYFAKTYSTGAGVFQDRRAAEKLFFIFRTIGEHKPLSCFIEDSAINGAKELTDTLMALLLAVNAKLISYSSLQQGEFSLEGKNIWGELDNLDAVRKQRAFFFQLIRIQLNKIINGNKPDFGYNGICILSESFPDLIVNIMEQLSFREIKKLFELSSSAEGHFMTCLLSRNITVDSKEILSKLFKRTELKEIILLRLLEDIKTDSGYANELANTCDNNIDLICSILDEKTLVKFNEAYLDVSSSSDRLREQINKKYADSHHVKIFYIQGRSSKSIFSHPLKRKSSKENSGIIDARRNKKTKLSSVPLSSGVEESAAISSTPDTMGV